MCVIVKCTNEDPHRRVGGDGRGGGILIVEMKTRIKNISNTKMNHDELNSGPNISMRYF